MFLLKVVKAQNDMGEFCLLKADRRKLKETKYSSSRRSELYRAD